MSRAKKSILGWSSLYRLQKISNAARGTFAGLLAGARAAPPIAAAEPDPTIPALPEKLGDVDVDDIIILLL